MKSILLALRLFLKNYKINIVIIIQIVISTLILLSLLGKLQGIYKAGDITDIIQSKNSLYVYLYDYTMDDSGNASDEFYNMIMSYEGVDSIGEIKNLYLNINDEKKITGLSYNDSIINNIHIKPQKGIWFTENSNNDYIPVVAVGNSYKLNEIITFSITPERACKGKIIGIFENDSYILTFNSGANNGNASLSDFITKANDCLIMPQSSLLNEDLIWTTNQPGKMIFMSDNADTGQMESALSEYGGISNVEQLKNNYKTEISEFMIKNGIAFLFFFILVLAGIGGNNAIQSIRNEKTFSIYYILGLTTGKCAQIEALRGIIIFVISFITTFFVYNISAIRNIISNDNIIINTTTFIFVFIYLILIYLISSGMFIFKVFKLNPIVLYRKKD